MEAQLYARVQHYAAHYDYDSAIFIAEQLLAACRQHHAQQGSSAQPQSELQQLAASLLHSTAPSPSPSLASSPSSSFLHSVVLLLAQCYYDSGTAGVAKAYHLLLSTLPSFSAPLCVSDAEHQHRYLLSLAAFDLQKLQEAERLLLPLLSLPSFAAAASSPSVYNLLATLCLRTGRKDEAVRYHRLALSLDPFLFSSCSALANLGVELDTELLFPFASSSSSPLSGDATPSVKRASSDPSAASPRSSGSLSALLQPTAASLLSYQTPSFPASAFSPPLKQPVFITPAPRPPFSSLLPANTAAAASAVPVSTPPSLSPSSSRSRQRASPAGGKTVKRAPGQQKLTFAADKKAGTAKTARGKAGGKAEPSRAGRAEHQQQPQHGRTMSLTGLGGLSGVKKKLSDAVEMELGGGAGGELETGTAGGGWKEEEEEMKEDTGKDARDGDDQLQQEEERSEELAEGQQVVPGLSDTAARSLFRALAAAYSALSLYRPRSCIRLLSSLPPSHSRTPFVLASLGRAHFELLDYPASIFAFQQLQSLYPHHLQWLDLYSTALWQCKRDSLLSALSQSLSSLSSVHPVTCVVIGNCFSLHREHETALRFFKRAVQLDGGYAYAYTLAGHEYVSMEDLQSGLQCFRQAIGLDARQYSAWCGIGSLLMQQEKYEQALTHFQHALSINRQSSLLRVYAAMALTCLQQLDAALAVLHDALQLGEQEEEAEQQRSAVQQGRQQAQCSNPQVYYQLANVYCLKREWEQALLMCRKVEALVWREASVYVLMGRVLRRLGRTEEAMRAFVIAMDLDPKDSNAVRHIMDKMINSDKQAAGGAAAKAGARGEQGGSSGNFDDDDDKDDADDEGF